jgi:hypothetical protein
MEGIYYLTYRESKNPKKCNIGIKYPGKDSKHFIIIGGRRARELYNFIIQLLDNNSIRYSIIEDGKEKMIKLPLATGLATSIYLLAIYSSLRPLRYATALEKMILGKMPLMKYFVTLTELATNLSNLLGKTEKRTCGGWTLNKNAAKVVSRMMLELMKGIA